MSVNKMDNHCEEKKMRQEDYRVKIDVSKFNDDESKKLCYVYIDVNKIKKVSDLMKRIETLFSVDEEEFYLLIEDVFLPVDEDIRIIKAEEIVTIAPGSAECKLNFKSNKKSLTKLEESEESEESLFTCRPTISLSLNDLPEAPLFLKKEISSQDILEIDCDLKLNINSITVRFQNDASTKKVAFVFDLIPRADKNLIIGNFYENGTWGSGKSIGGFMVDNCSSIKLRISCENKGFRSFINDDEVFFYSYRFPPKTLAHLVAFKN